MCLQRCALCPGWQLGRDHHRGHWHLCGQHLQRGPDADLQGTWGVLAAGVPPLLRPSVGCRPGPLCRRHPPGLLGPPAAPVEGYAGTLRHTVWGPLHFSGLQASDPPHLHLGAVSPPTQSHSAALLHLPLSAAGAGLPLRGLLLALLRGAGAGAPGDGLQGDCGICSISGGRAAVHSVPGAGAAGGQTPAACFLSEGGEDRRWGESVLQRGLSQVSRLSLFILRIMIHFISYFCFHFPSIRGRPLIRGRVVTAAGSVELKPTVRILTEMNKTIILDEHTLPDKMNTDNPAYYSCYYTACFCTFCLYSQSFWSD